MSHRYWACVWLANGIDESVFFQEPETMEEVKKQHEERAIDFLVNELEVYETEEEAQEGF